MVFLTLDKTNFKTINIIRNKEGHHIVLKDLIHQKDKHFISYVRVMS